MKRTLPTRCYERHGAVYLAAREAAWAAARAEFDALVADAFADWL